LTNRVIDAPRENLPVSTWQCIEFVGLCDTVLSSLQISSGMGENVLHPSVGGVSILDNIGSIEQVGGPLADEAVAVTVTCEVRVEVDTMVTIIVNEIFLD
jgi:hypothetical protein